MLPTIFYILKSLNLTSNPNFYIILAYFLEAVLDSSSLLAPVQTIFPEANTSAVDLGY